MTDSQQAREAFASLELFDGERSVAVHPTRLVVAGYTGRDETAVRAHIDELAAIGVAPPPEVPMLYELDTDLLTTDPRIRVDGAGTSGEVEPVLIRCAGQWYLGVGSDHTDRDLERADVAGSKAACAKPLGRRVVALPEGVADGAVDSDWDRIGATSTVDGVPYQDGKLSGLRLPSDLIPRVVGDDDDGGDLVIYCGTLPVIDGEFRVGAAWTCELALPSGVVLTHSYQVDRRLS